MRDHSDRLVTDYLAEVARATAGLPPARRSELLSDLREHIDVERAELPAETEAQVRSILDRLGEPDLIAAEAGADVPSGTPVPADAPPTAARSWRTAVVVTVAIATAVLLVLCFVGAFFVTRASTDSPPAPIRTTTG